MDDESILDLYWARSELAIAETSAKYGRYCRYISYHILNNDQDAEECVNDTYLRAWNVIPPQRPNCLSTFLGKIVRNLSIDKYRQATAGKRGGTELVLSELDDCVPSGATVEQSVEEELLSECIDRFLAGLPPAHRIIFVRRYWYLCSIREIAGQLHMSESKVKSLLFRLRKQLKRCLEEEGITL